MKKDKKMTETQIYNVVSLLKSRFYKKRGATFFYDITRKSGPLDFT